MMQMGIHLQDHNLNLKPKSLILVEHNLKSMPPHKKLLLGAWPLVELMWVHAVLMNNETQLIISEGSNGLSSQARPKPEHMCESQGSELLPPWVLVLR